MQIQKTYNSSKIYWGSTISLTGSSTSGSGVAIGHPNIYYLRSTYGSDYYYKPVTGLIIPSPASKPTAWPADMPFAVAMNPESSSASISLATTPLATPPSGNTQTDFFRPPLLSEPQGADRVLLTKVSMLAKRCYVVGYLEDDIAFCGARGMALHDTITLHDGTQYTLIEETYSAICVRTL